MNRISSMSKPFCKMPMTTKAEEVYAILDRTFPEAHCELLYRDEFELLCAVMLSAQTTDERVNAVTPFLFAKYPDVYALSSAIQEDVEGIIASLGLYHNKATNLIAMAKALVKDYDGKVPKDKKALTSLPGVGDKTANVVLAEAFGIPAFAVDTHVSRVAKRLGFARKDDDVSTIEKKLCRAFREDYWIKSHHLFIFFGRYLCKAKKPDCDHCPLSTYCKFKAEV